MSLCVYLYFSATIKEAYLRSALFNSIWLNGTCLKWSMCYRKRFIGRPNHKSHPVLRQGRPTGQRCLWLSKSRQNRHFFLGCLELSEKSSTFHHLFEGFFPNCPSSPWPQLCSISKSIFFSSVFLLNFMYISIRALITMYFPQTFIKH